MTDKPETITTTRTRRLPDGRMLTTTTIMPKRRPLPPPPRLLAVNLHHRVACDEPNEYRCHAVYAGSFDEIRRVGVARVLVDPRTVDANGNASPFFQVEIRPDRPIVFDQFLLNDGSSQFWPARFPEPVSLAAGERWRCLVNLTGGRVLVEPVELAPERP